MSHGPADSHRPGDRAREGRQLNRTPIGAARTAPDALGAASTADADVRVLIHELAGLVDGSLRCLKLARQDLTGADLGRVQGDDLRRHLDAAHHALGHMADLIRAVSGPGGFWGDGPGAAAGAPSFAGVRPLRESIEHAVEIVRPLADERGLRLECVIASGIDSAPPAPVYPLLVNALRNAIEAYSGAPIRDRRGGVIELHIRAEARGGGVVELAIDVMDDGPGPPTTMLHRVFEPGFSTKAGGHGLGLAVCRDIAEELGGTIELRPRWPERGTAGPIGARLSVRLRLQTEPSTGLIGGPRV